MRGAAGLSLLLMLCCGVSTAPTVILSQNDSAPTLTPLTSERKPKVSPPFNLVMESYNFNTTLYWDYQDTPVAPIFTVQIHFYMDGNTSVVKKCRKISKRFCDLSQEVRMPEDYYSGRVKAIVGDEESEYAVSPKPLHLPTDGKIGPPTLNVSMAGEKVLIDVWHPLTPFKSMQTVRDFYEDFTYTVYFGKKEIEFDDEDCDLDACVMSITPPKQGVTYCISAKGKSRHWGLVGERSEETCIDVPDIEPKKVHRYRISVIVVFSIFAIILIVLAMVFVYKVLQEKTIKLPKSLASFAFNFGTPTVSHEATFCSTPPEEVSPVSLVNERELLLNSQPTFQLNDESPLQPVTDLPQHSIESGSSPVLHETESQSNEYAVKTTPSSSSSNTEKDNYFHSNSGSTELSSLTSTSGPPCSSGRNTEEKPSTNVMSQSFGYDKPHVPLSHSTQVGEGESVIG